MSVDQTMLFRCVCGASIGVEYSAGGNCKNCGRKYSSDAINVAATMTVDGSGPRLGFDDDEMLGKAIDHFTIVNRLGAGGMGTVYRALDESLQRYVALKLLRPQVDHAHDEASDTTLVTTLLEEARAQARVNHANVVHVYYVSRDPKLPYLAMELLPDGTVADKLKKGRMPYGDVVSLGLQIAEALRESTKFDIVHGDIKPCNILISGQTAKLSDFGLAQRVAPNGGGDGRLSGTPNYMPPEICAGKPASAQSDMYSFGVMLFEMTFRRLPFHFKDSSAVSRIDAHLHRPVEFPDPWPNDIPLVWKDFLSRLLAKHPEQRFESWAALSKELHSLRPLQPVIAGRVKRGIAWNMDLLVQVVVMLALTRVADILLPSTKVFGWIMILSGLVVPALMMFWISRGRSTPGKALMQLRIVDRYGLKKNPKVLAWRSMISYLPIWMLPTAERTEIVGLPDWVWQPLWIIMGLFIAVDILVALFRKDGRSIHDELFDTRVVLDEAGRDR